MQNAANVYDQQNAQAVSNSPRPACRMTGRRTPTWRGPTAVPPPVVCGVCSLPGPSVPPPPQPQPPYGPRRTGCNRCRSRTTSRWGNLPAERNTEVSAENYASTGYFLANRIAIKAVDDMTKHHVIIVIRNFSSWNQNHTLC